jgi:hypothetical protein
MIERWVAIQGYRGAYEVSDQGRVRTVKEPRIKSQCSSRTGYKKVTLYTKSKGLWCLVHQLVLIAFSGVRPKKHCGAHLNGNKQDNRAINLKWVTYKENSLHRVLHGTDCAGEKNGRAKLKNLDAIQIRRRFYSGELVWAIHKDYPFVNYCAIKRVAHGITWKMIRI